MNFFFSFNFPLREYFFYTSPAHPPPPYKFSNGLTADLLSSNKCMIFIARDYSFGGKSKLYVKRCITGHSEARAPILSTVEPR